jgi:hypothetical protein
LTSSIGSVFSVTGKFEGLTANDDPENQAFIDLEQPASFPSRPQNGIVQLNSAQQEIRTDRYLKVGLIQIQQTVPICFESVQLLDRDQWRAEPPNVHITEEVADVDLRGEWCGRE